jgi:hypothetical protein
MRLGRRYGDGRLEAAAARALAVRALSYRSVESMLKAGLDGLPIPGTMDDTAHTRAINQAGGNVDPASMERQRAVDNRRMHCRQVDGATICDGE